MNETVNNQVDTWVTYPWSPWDLSDPTKIFATCADCDWKLETKSTKKPAAFYKHYDKTHR